MKEQDIQRKIIKHLEEELGCVTIKIITASKAGFPDIVACSAVGSFIGIEVKMPGKKPSRLQAYRLEEFRKRHAISFYADSYDDYRNKIQACIDMTDQD